MLGTAKHNLLGTANCLAQAGWRTWHSLPLVGTASLGDCSKLTPAAPSRPPRLTQKRADAWPGTGAVPGSYLIPVQQQCSAKSRMSAHLRDCVAGRNTQQLQLICILVVKYLTHKVKDYLTELQNDRIQSPLPSLLPHFHAFQIFSESDGTAVGEAGSELRHWSVTVSSTGNLVLKMIPLPIPDCMQLICRNGQSGGRTDW